MYTHTGKALLFTALLGFVIADIGALLSVCAATPAPSLGAAGAAIVFQLCALGALAFCLQYFRSTWQPPRHATGLNRMKIVVMAAVFCLLSAVLFRHAVLFADTLSSPRGTRSAGSACFP